jgi:phosphate transport system substrate-binding protein
VPCYNLGGLDKPLNFSSDTLAAIFLGKITKWNDPAIQALNPSVHLPADDIIIIGHAGEDGSAYAWTDFLSKTNAEWQHSVGRVRSIVALPALVRAPTSKTLAELVKHTPNSITYTEFWATKGLNLQIGRVKNRSGNCIGPSSASIAAAALTASPAILDDFRASITDTSGPTDYPIASFKWIVIPDKFRDSAKQSKVLSLLKLILTEGQYWPDSMRLGRLPRSIAEREIHLIESLQ